MTTFEWCCIVGVVVGFTLLLWVGWGCPQEVDPLDTRLDRIEQSIDELLKQEESTPVPPAKTPPKKSRPARRAPSMFTPLETRLPDLPRVEALPESFPAEPPARVCCHRSWQEIDAARAERAFAGGD